jgi:hypothetical protein
VFAAVVLVAPPLSTAFGKKPILGGEHTITARPTGSAPAIDGVMSPGEWSAAVPVHVKFNHPFTKPGVIPGGPNFPPPDNQDALSYKVQAIDDDDNRDLAIDVVIDDIIGTQPFCNDDVGPYPSQHNSHPSQHNARRWVRSTQTTPRNPPQPSPDLAGN